MAGFIKCAILMVFLLTIAPPLPHPIQYVPPRPRDRITFLCTMMASALVIWFIPGADREDQLFRGLMQLGVGLSAASFFLLVAPVVTCNIVGCDISDAMAIAGAASVAAGGLVKVVLLASDI